MIDKSTCYSWLVHKLRYKAREKRYQQTNGRDHEVTGAATLYTLSAISRFPQKAIISDHKELISITHY